MTYKRQQFERQKPKPNPIAKELRKFKHRIQQQLEKKPTKKELLNYEDYDDNH